MSAASDFELPSVDGRPLRLAELRAGGPVVLLFVSEECPTCVLALRRLAPLTPALRDAGVTLAAVFEDLPEGAARPTRATGFGATVLAEPAPYAVSRAYGLEGLPTAVLVDAAREAVARCVGWDAAGSRACWKRRGCGPAAARRRSPSRASRRCSSR